ncbi:tlde1 domain-containing protein [Paraburkholderia youngii]|uniref:tlde1 domain-containing protein n=1 Tax=Paraburkholderia youngii TaxID=2782701 RepID=UPI003D20B876
MRPNIKPQPNLGDVGAHNSLAKGRRSYKLYHKAAGMCTPRIGAIPVGRYYIFDRRSGGILGPWKDRLNLNGNNKSEWFALYAIDANIDDDKVLCDGIIRGQFRLHPKGRLGRSEGCITSRA